MFEKGMKSCGQVLPSRDPRKRRRTRKFGENSGCSTQYRGCLTGPIGPTGYRFHPMDALVQGSGKRLRFKTAGR